ncbi:type IV toxin-antitoxin system AbiEi family antitoxin domain-containing protein [Microbacterium resistens]|uniref:Type IV toxin-antitoxin system AbiEi family antitoxin n=1 Tax=Microbacterium resistens TaxID=156977 RepID=A0ABY3RNI7_9MICO|nr:DUF6088 family protein [Microbacterium resistens]UGS25311.1 type IV toxin-antitoxin system AbiEi family antitoxin [Microbacterium resistens]
MTDLELLMSIARAPMRTATLRDVSREGENTWRALERLVDRGALVRLARGIYTAPPDSADGRSWIPPLEAAAAAVATARFGERTIALTGVSAARHWAAIPRAIGVATVAVPRRGYAPVVLSHGGSVRFVPRRKWDLDLVVEPTVLGEVLVTSPEQTLFDLIRSVAPEGLEADARDALASLAARSSPDVFDEIVHAARRVPPAAREMASALRRAHG